MGPVSDDQLPEQPPLPTFHPSERVCGNCKLWRAHSIHETRGWVGECRVQSSRGMFVPSAPICDVFAPRGEATPIRPEEVQRSRGRVVKNIAPSIVRKGPSGEIAVFRPTPQVRRTDGNEEVDLEGATMTKNELMDLFLEASGLADVPLAPKWEGGLIQMLPKDAVLQGKELPIDSLFHKVVMVRDRLRTLEQKINAHSKLTDTEKVDMQQYVTRCYGSLTSFNLLFRDRDDGFIGQKGDE